MPFVITSNVARLGYVLYLGMEETSDCDCDDTTDNKSTSNEKTAIVDGQIDNSSRGRKSK